MSIPHWKTEARNFAPRVPVDESVVALLRLPLGVTALYEVASVLDKHLGPGLAFQTGSGVMGWAVLALPADHQKGDQS